MARAAVLDDVLSQEYKSLLCSESIRRLFPRFVKQLLDDGKEEKASKGRVSLLEFEKDRPTRVTSFNQPDELLDHFVSTDDRPAGQRRLWILEDLPLNWMVILGSRLGVPPDLFASHWADPSGAEFNDRHTFWSQPGVRFMLKYTRFHPATIKGVRANGDLQKPNFIFDANVERYLFPSGDGDNVYEVDQFCRSFHNLSFWSAGPYQDKGWDAVMIVDPRLDKLCLANTPDVPEGLELDFRDDEYHLLFPSLDMPKVLATPNPGCPQPNRHFPSLFSVYDDIVNCLPLWEDGVGGPPHTCTVFALKMVVGFWLQFVRRRYRNLLTVTRPGLPRPCEADVGYLYRSGWLIGELSFEKNNKTLGSLVSARNKLDSLELEIAANRLALGLTQIEQEPAGADCCDRITDNAWEKRAWTDVSTVTSQIRSMVLNLTEAYQHSTAMSEARAANDMGRVVVKIGYITALLTPPATLAAYLAIDGPFGRGGEYWWAFWAVLTPTLAVSYFFFRPSSYYIIQEVFLRVVRAIWRSLKQSLRPDCTRDSQEDYEMSLC